VLWPKVKTYARTPGSGRDLEGALGGTATPADELGHPRLSDGAFAELVDVEPVVRIPRCT
jgi:hypothetical protein